MKPSEFNHIILPMRGQLLRYALKLTGSSDTAEDLVQEAMLRLWDMRSRLSADGSVMALATTIVRNCRLDQLRHDSHSAQMPERMDIAVEDRRAELRDETRLIRRIVDQLPPLQQQIFRMKEIDGYTADEIMQITGCTADNLRRNLSRARVKIRETYMQIMTKGAKR